MTSKITTILTRFFIKHTVHEMSSVHVLKGKFFIHPIINNHGELIVFVKFKWKTLFLAAEINKIYQ